ncbi:hypothetical protein HK096_008868, partial [Nowakowskiella sp. JEL0078]
FFMKSFADILKSEESEMREIGQAIRGFGMFAATAKEMVSAADMNDLLGLLIKRSNSMLAE